MIDLDAVADKLAAGGAIDHGPAGTGLAAAVAVILRRAANGAGVELFFILRAHRADDPWSGHVAFPGGRRELEDESLLATAIRETREEVGIELSLGELVARLPDVPAFARSKRGTLVVTCFVFVVRRDVDALPSDEVAASFWVPLATLAEEQGKATFELDYDGKKYEMPFIPLGPDQHRLWGMSYRMLITLLEALT